MIRAHSDARTVRASKHCIRSGILSHFVGTIRRIQKSRWCRTDDKLDGESDRTLATGLEIADLSVVAHGDATVIRAAASLLSCWQIWPRRR